MKILKSFYYKKYCGTAGQNIDIKDTKVAEYLASKGIIEKVKANVQSKN